MSCLLLCVRNSNALHHRYTQTLVAYAFAVCTLFNSARLASQLGSMFSMILFLPKYLLDATTPLGWRRFAYLSGPVAFSDCFSAMAASEVAKVGITWDNLHGTNQTPLGFDTAVAFMFLDVCLYLLLALYLDQVMPSEYGTPKAWNWFCTSGFWRSSRANGDHDRLLPYPPPAELGPVAPHPLGSSDNSSNDIGPVPVVDAQVEMVPDTHHELPTLTLRNLRREFDRAAGFGCGFCGSQPPLVAVDGLDLTMYEGEIFALLGHNGAGNKHPHQLVLLLRRILPPARVAGGLTV